MKTLFPYLPVGFVSFFGACTIVPVQPEMTPLEIQSIQSRYYPESQNIVFRSVISVFQDLGYTIKSADASTGFIQANSSARSNELLRLSTGETETKQTKATGFVERVGSKTLVRLNFITTRETSTALGAHDRNEIPVLEAQTYRNAFERIEHAIFVRQAVN